MADVRLQIHERVSRLTDGWIKMRAGINAFALTPWERTIFQKITDALDELDAAEDLRRKAREEKGAEDE